MKQILPSQPEQTHAVRMMRYMERKLERECKEPKE